MTTQEADALVRSVLGRSKAILLLPKRTLVDRCLSVDGRAKPQAVAAAVSRLLAAVRHHKKPGPRPKPPGTPKRQLAGVNVERPIHTLVRRLAEQDGCSLREVLERLVLEEASIRGLKADLI